MAKELESRLQIFFQENRSEDTAPIINWEAHKCVARGFLIKAAAKRNKERRKQYADLTERIRLLEISHKHTLALTTLQDLCQAQAELLEVIGKRIRRKFILAKKTFYKYGNKASKLLARTLQSKKATTTVHSLTDERDHSMAFC